MQTWITWLRRFSIRSRLLACMALVVVIGLILGAAMSAQLLQLQDSLDGFAEQEFAATQRVGQMAQVLGQLRANEGAALINAGDSVTVEQEVKQWTTHLAELKTLLGAIEQKAPSPEVAKHAKGMQQQLQAYAAGMQPTLDLLQTSAMSSSAEAFQATADGRQQASALDKTASTLRAQVEILAQSRREQTNASVKQATIGLWVMLLAPGLVFLPLMGLTILSITGPLRRAEEITQKIAQGDLTREIAPRGQDEIARVMTAMKHMQESLREMVSSVRVSSESMLLASTEIAAGNQDLSNRTEQTASNLQETASSMDQLHATVDRSAQSANTANELAGTASQRAQHGGTGVRR